MSWGERSCEHFYTEGACPNPDVTYETCNMECPYYKRKASFLLMDSLPKGYPPVVLQVKKIRKKRKKKKRRK